MLPGDRTIGETLTVARLEKGLDVDDVARATRIRATLIRDIESDRFGSCGAAVYARGHLRSIAHVVGLDPAPLVAAYDDQHGVVPPSLGTAIPVTFDGATAARADRRPGPRWGAAASVAVAVVAGLAIVGVFRPADTGGAPDRAAVRPVAASPAAPAGSPGGAPLPTPEATDEGDDRVAAVPADGVSLRVRVTGAQSWVSVRDGKGRLLFEEVLRRGQVEDFRDAAQLRLIVGDAAAVQLVVNGRDLGAAGEAGEVARVRFTPEDPPRG